MTASTEIAKYYASFGFKIDPTSITNLKRNIESVKASLAKTLNITLNVSKVSIKKRELNASLKEEMGKIGGVKLSINSFAVNAVELRRSVQAAFDKGVTLRVNAQTRTSTSTPRSPRPQGGGGATNGVLSRYGLQGLAGYATGVGFGNMNQMSEDLQTGMVALDTITKGRGTDAYGWLKNQAGEVGFDFRSQLPQFSNFLGASINKLGYDDSLNTYKSITNYGLTHGADRVSSERAMMALGQMMSKGKINAEELNQQLAEAKGFSGVKSIIAEAYQEKIGGTLTGQKAEEALIAAMKKGLVNTMEVMPIMARRMAEQSDLSNYQKTTVAAHGRFSTSLVTAMERFSKGGFGEGMTRFFSFLAKWLDSHGSQIENLGKAFLILEKVFESIVSVGGTLISFFADINPAITLLAASIGILYSKFKMMGIVWGILYLIFDDIDTYISGGDSLLGRFFTYMKDLTGLDLQGFAVGLGAIGIAITAAFSPITAAILSIGALIEMYKAVKAYDEANSTTAERNRRGAGRILPSQADLEAGYIAGLQQEANNATNPLSGFVKQMGAWNAGLNQYVAPNLSKSAISSSANLGEYTKYLSADEQQRLRYAVGSGTWTEQNALDYMESRKQQVNASRNGSPQPTTIVNNVTANGVIGNTDDFANHVGGILNELTKSQYSPQQSQPSSTATRPSQ